MRYDPIYRRLFAQEPSTESDEETNSATVLSADEVRGIVYDVLEERISASEAARIAKLDLLDELLGKAGSERETRP